MIKTNSKKCIGCGACASVCPKNCLAMKIDSEGFFYPTIENSDCIECGACERVCSIEKQAEPIQIICSYAVKNKNEDIRKDSSSGGAFFEIAKFVVENEGVVFGAAFDENWAVHHIECSNVSELIKLRNSKYLQSDINEIYKKVKEDLDQNKKVLFSGAPCQCNGLSLFLGKKYDNLIMVDFICHGIPSPLVWQKYLQSVAKGKTVTYVNFRDKSNGWQNYNVCINCSDNTFFKVPFYEDPYMRLFLSDYILRPSCYSCRSKFPNKTADITIGDLWGADNIVSDNDNKGITFVTVNSIKGQEVFEKIKSNFECETIDFDKAVKYNSNAISSVVIPKNRNKVMRLVCNNNPNFDKIANKFCNRTTLFGKVKYIIKKIYKKVF